VEEELSSKISALPPNSTSIYQPLDVGVMGSFKQIIRRMWFTDLKLLKKKGKQQ